MASEICPSCGAAEVRFSSRRARHLLRCLVGTRKRYCGQCKARWGSGTVGGWPIPVRLAVLAACGGAAWTVSHAKLVRREPPQTAIYYRSGGAAVPGGAEAAAGDSPSNEAPAALVDRPGGTTADWLRAHQQDSGVGEQPRGPKGLLARLGLDKLSKMFQLKFRGLTRGQAAQLESELKKDKRQLWKEYGSNFDSKEEAKKAYDQAQQALKESKAAKP